MMTEDGIFIPEPETEVTFNITKTPNYTAEELDMVVRMVIAESGAEPYEGQLGVAQVIYDRVNYADKGAYGDGVEGVLTASHQFTKPYSGDVSDFPDAIKAVDEVFMHGYRQFEEVAVCFFNPKYANANAVVALRKYNYLGTIGGHEFRGDIRIA